MVTTAPPASSDEDMPPAYEGGPISQSDELGITLLAQPSSHELLVSLIPPTAPRPGEKTSGQRAPLDLCLVIDVSGSMDSEAPIPGGQGKNETTGLSVLDVVKHATRTIIESMSDNDRIAIVTFSDTAEVVTSLTPMTKENRARVWGEVDRLRTIGLTNLWHGLKTGMNVITGTTPEATANPDPFNDPTDDKRELSAGRSQRLSAVFVLTDGQPNVEPPRGHIPMLKSYLGALPSDSPKFTISTFGFGYSLDSRLLDEIADIGQGTYGFIPDSGMIGTVFIHAVANLMATWARGCVLDVKLTKQDPSAQIQLEALGALPVKLSGCGATIQIGDIQYGQSRDIVLKLPAQCFVSDPDYTVKVIASYIPHTLANDAPPLQTIQNLGRGHEVNNSVIIQHEAYRLSFIRTIAKLFKDYQRDGGNKPDGSRLQQALANYTNDPLLKDHEPSTALTSDIMSQVVLGLQSEHWSRWGVHYIPSLARSHQRQQCSNFKDPGLQVYGRDSPLFTSTRDAIDQTFDSLPPPKPSLGNRGSYRSQSFGRSPPIAMSYSLGAPPPPPAFQAQAFQAQAKSSQAQSYSPGYRGITASLSSTRDYENESGDRGLVIDLEVDVDDDEEEVEEDDDMGFGLFSPPPPPGSRAPPAPLAPGARSARFASYSPSAMSGTSSYAPVSSMSAYNSRSAPCFAGWCLVDLGNGQKIKVSDLHRGIVVLTPTGTSRVAVVLRTICLGGVTNLCFVGALAVTPWHPIKHGGSWVFPAKVCEPESMLCDYVYSILLEPSHDPNEHALCIDGVWCVTLGHGCTDSVRAHTFLGDYTRVVNSLSQMKGYYGEGGIIDGAGIVRDNNTGLVCGFRSPEAEDIHILKNSWLDPDNHNMQNEPSVLTAIRIHQRQSDQNVSFNPAPVCAAVQRALGYSTSVVLAVSLPQPDVATLLLSLPGDTTLHDGSEDNLRSARVHVIPFTRATYGRFIPALNAIVAFAHAKGFTQVLFQSVEVDVEADKVRKMAEMCGDDVLVVGKAFDAHTFHSPPSGQALALVYLTGRTCPWNTLALWDVHKLARTGFLLTSETHTPPNSSAIEEAPTIALHQKLFPGQSRAILLRFGDEDGWGTTWTDPARAEWHARKLASKDTSAAAHISNIGLVGSTTIVEHVQIQLA